LHLSAFQEFQNELMSCPASCSRGFSLPFKIMSGKHHVSTSNSSLFHEDLTSSHILQYQYTAHSIFPEPNISLLSECC
jgi:hypothetical protein